MYFLVYLLYNVIINQIKGYFMVQSTKKDKNFILLIPNSNYNSFFSNEIPVPLRQPNGDDF